MFRIRQVLTIVLLCSVVCSTSFALPPFKKAFDEYYGKNGDLKKLSETAKCEVCHLPAPEPKKKRNDYGQALSEFLKKADFQAPRLTKEPDQVKKEIEAAFKKVEGMKTKDGKETFGDR